MKTLKFNPDLVKLILNGEKTTTWRLFDDKNLATGDRISLINHSTLKQFGTGMIEKAQIKTMATLTDEDWEGHEKFSSKEEMYKTYRSYYNDKVGPDTEVKIIKFSFTPLD